MISPPGTTEAIRNGVERRLESTMLIPPFSVTVGDDPVEGTVHVRIVHDGALDPRTVNAAVADVERYLAPILPVGIRAIVEAFAAPLGPRCVLCQHRRNAHTLDGRCPLQPIVGDGLMPTRSVVNMFTPFKSFSIDLGGADG